MIILQNFLRVLRKRTGIGITSLLLATIATGILLQTNLSMAATPTFKQAKANEISSGTVDSVAFTSANVAGNLIVVEVLWSNTGTVTLSDTRGNTYAAATTRATWSGSWSEQVFYAKNIAAGTNTVKATFATSISSFAIVQIHEYSGIDKVNPFDGGTAGSGLWHGHEQRLHNNHECQRFAVWRRWFDRLYDRYRHWLHYAP